MLWLVAGITAGAGVTMGAVFAVLGLIRGDAPTEAFGPPRYVEEADTSGINHVYDGEFHFFVGGGVAVFDCNEDRRPDLYFAGGANPAGLYRNESTIGGALRFTPVRDTVTEMTDVAGAYPLDIDSDGRTDLAVLRVGENVVLRGLGECRFERANERWALDGGNEWTVAFSAQWENTEALPTLAFGNYLALDETEQEAARCSDHYFFRPDGDAYGAATTLSPGWCTLSILFSDWDGSGRRDLRMTNDRHYYRDGEEQLWQVTEGEAPRLYTRDQGWERLEIWGMGIASHDLTGDGLPEVFLTSQGDNKLQTLADGPGQPAYEDIALQIGANAHRPFLGDSSRPSTAWHAEFQDVNNDGFIDLFVTKGNVEAMPEFAEDDPNNLLLGRPDGTFIESADTAGIIDYARSRGAALTDLNLDGMLDLVVVDRRENVKIWRNLGSGDSVRSAPIGNWLAIELTQRGANRDAIGSWVEVRLGNMIGQREVLVGGGHAGGQLGWIHIGLGVVKRADIRVQWPDSETGPWMTVDANQFLIVERGAREARSWLPVPD
jgi:enediyne biosynthesis protein E4